MPPRPRRRRWAQWPGRISQELNGVSGLASLGGIAITAGSLTFLAGTAALALTGVGTTIVFGAIGYAAFKAVPPRMQHPNHLVGRNVSIGDLGNVSPPLPTVAIIGATQAGKTTLKNRLAHEHTSTERTQSISAFIISLQTAPPIPIAILDGGGDKYAQQFKIAEICDYLCIMIDHNISDAEISVNKDRLSDHASFLKQVGHHLDETRPC